MTDISWQIDTKSNGSLTLPGSVGDTMPVFRIGAETEITLLADDDLSGFNILREYVRYSNGSTMNTGLDIRGKPWYYESIHPKSDFESAIVKLEPGTDVGDMRSWWGVITEASFVTNTVGTDKRIVLTIFVLAEGEEYNDRVFVEDAFETNL